MATRQPKQPTRVRAPRRPPKKSIGTKRRGPQIGKAGAITLTEVTELDNLRKQLQRTAASQSASRWNADPADVQRSVGQLVLTLVEFIRKLLERQSIRRMEAGTLTDRQVEDVGRALMQLEETVRDMAARFGIPPEDLNLELGPFGKLM